MAEVRDLYFNIDVSDVLKILSDSQLSALLDECSYELERRIASNER